MDWCHYHFRCPWDLDHPPTAVYAVLAAVEEYPRWWPQVREMVRLDDETASARIRSLIPYDLVLTARRLREDPRAGVLAMTMSGDLEGWARWTLSQRGSGTRVVFEQDVWATKPLLRRLAVPCRPAFRANHWLMMRAGLRGLRSRLAVAPPSGRWPDGSGGVGDASAPHR